MALKAYVYRLRDENKNAFELGIAIVPNLEGLFWTLDEFTNPYDYEFAEARAGDALSTAVEVCDDPDADGWMCQTDKPVKGEYLSERMGEPEREWRRFKSHHRDVYRTIKVS